jgi:hypothetical protein
MRAALPCGHLDATIHRTRACCCYPWSFPVAAGYVRRVGWPKSKQPPMTHVTGAQSFWPTPHDAGAHLGFQTRGRREARATLYRHQRRTG